MQRVLKYEPANLLLRDAPGKGIGHRVLLDLKALFDVEIHSPDLGRILNGLCRPLKAPRRRNPGAVFTARAPLLQGHLMGILLADDRDPVSYTHLTLPTI